MKRYDFDRLRKDMAKAARRTFGFYRDSHPGELFYAFALYTDDDAGGAIPAASSEQSLQRVIKRYTSGGYSLPGIGHLRYCPDEWAYCGGKGAGDEWARIWQVN